MNSKVTYELVAKYLTGNCNEGEKQQVETWRDSKSDNMEAFSQYRAIWENAKPPADSFVPDVENALKAINKQLTSVPYDAKRSKIVPFVTYTRRIAAAILLGAGIWLAYTLLWKNQEEISLIAESGNTRKEVVLSDGTHIWLNTSSMLRYPEKFKGKERKVYIEGEAFFDVAKNPGMPFIIETSQSVVAVLGTEFNLRARKDEVLTIVTVTEGKVSFSGKIAKTHKPVYLTAGDKGLLNTSINELNVEKNQGSNALAWKTGKLVFYNTPLDKVATDLSNYFNTNVTVENIVKKEIPFTSTFENQHLHDILKIMELSLGIKVDSTSYGVILK
jgi:ferric-dicitrate binding protein FerR (iron transport regulator)